MHVQLLDMSLKEKEMAKLLAKADRQERFSAVMAYINADVSTILDLGCGIGALTSQLAERFPSALVVGFDRSKHLLEKLAQRGKSVLTVLGELPYLPFEENSFDLVVTMQVLHEIFHFRGIHALDRTLRNVHNSLKKKGKLIIFDHVNPGNTRISLELPEEMLQKLHEFQSKFKPRKITFSHLGKGRIETSMRDFYDFVTKIWALNSGLEEEEMSETHTPFTCQELVNLVQEAGFEVTHTSRLTPIDRHLEYYGIALESAKKLPNRHIILQAKK